LRLLGEGVDDGDEDLSLFPPLVTSIVHMVLYRLNDHRELKRMKNDSVDLQKWTKLRRNDRPSSSSTIDGLAHRYLVRSAHVQFGFDYFGQTLTFDQKLVS